jgi:general secretion pathway protein L
MLAKALDEPAEGAMFVVSALRPRRRLRLVEQADDAFLVSDHKGRALRSPARLRFAAGAFVGDDGARAVGGWKGAEIELVLAERRFLFPTIQAPRNAAEFLDAFVRSQIDRLTPWTRTQAEVGFASAASANGETRVTLAAASKATLAPYVEAARALGAATVVVSAARSEGAAIRVCAREIEREARARRYRRALGVVLAASVVFALGASALEARLSGERQTLEDEIARRVAALRRDAAGPARDAQVEAALRRKREVQPAVVVLEALSRALPDDSYLTQLRISGARLEIDGVSRSASSLVALLEQTEPFQRAQFSAPTTPAAADGAEQFHIAADIVAATKRRP